MDTRRVFVFPNRPLYCVPYHASFLIATEDFDEALDRRIRTLAAERELVQVQTAERRAKTPAAIRGLVDDLVRRKLAAEYIPDEPTEDLPVEREPLERKDEMEQTLDETLAMLRQLEQVSFKDAPVKPGQVTLDSFKHV